MTKMLTRIASIFAFALSLTAVQAHVFVSTKCMTVMKNVPQSDPYPTHWHTTTERKCSSTSTISETSTETAVPTTRVTSTVRTTTTKTVSETGTLTKTSTRDHTTTVTEGPTFVYIVRHHCLEKSYLKLSFFISQTSTTITTVQQTFTVEPVSGFIPVQSSLPNSSYVESLNPKPGLSRRSSVDRPQREVARRRENSYKYTRSVECHVCTHSCSVKSKTVSTTTTITEPTSTITKR